jgi:hypothetical protein
LRTITQLNAISQYCNFQKWLFATKLTEENIELTPSLPAGKKMTEGNSVMDKGRFLENHTVLNKHAVYLRRFIRVYILQGTSSSCVSVCVL